MTDWLDDRAALARSHARSLDVGRAWTGAFGGRVAAAFAGADAADVEASAAAAERLLSDADWIADALPTLADALVGDPAFVPPFRVHRDALRTGMVLHDGTHATIAVSVLSADALATLPRPTTVVAGGRVSVVRYCRAGGAALRVWDAPLPAGDLDAGAMPRCTAAAPVALADSAVLRLDGRVHAHLVEDAAADVVTVTATLRAGAAAQAREYARADGRFIRAAALDETESRTRMLLTLLRVSGRDDAGACFDAATREPGFALRWAAMREWLALDAHAARGRLAEMTRDPNAEVRAAACATLALVDQRLAA